jgi:hypothetical protein
MPGATHYKLYRNTTNNTITAEAIGSWTTTRYGVMRRRFRPALLLLSRRDQQYRQNPTDFSGKTPLARIMPPIADASDGTSTDHVLVQWNTPTARTTTASTGVSGDVNQATALTDGSRQPLH